MQASNVSNIDLCGDSLEPLERLTPSTPMSQSKAMTAPNRKVQGKCLRVHDSVVVIPKLSLSDSFMIKAKHSAAKKKNKKTKTKKTERIEDCSVSSLTAPVENLSIHNNSINPWLLPFTFTSPEKRDSTEDETSSDTLCSPVEDHVTAVALAVSTFMEDRRHLNYRVDNSDSEELSLQPPLKKRGRFQRRNSFVVHLARNELSLHDDDDGDNDDSMISTGNPLLQRNYLVDNISTTKWDQVSRGGLETTSGTLGLSQRESSLVFQRMSLPWKRKSHETEEGDPEAL